MLFVILLIAGIFLLANRASQNQGTQAASTLPAQRVMPVDWFHRLFPGQFNPGVPGLNPGAGLDANNPHIVGPIFLPPPSTKAGGSGSSGGSSAGGTGSGGAGLQPPGGLHGIFPQ